jgi:hypothetical protein
MGDFTRVFIPDSIQLPEGKRCGQIPRQKSGRTEEKRLFYSMWLIEWEHCLPSQHTNRPVSGFRCDEIPLRDSPYHWVAWLWAVRQPHFQQCRGPSPMVRHLRIANQQDNGRSSIGQPPFPTPSGPFHDGQNDDRLCHPDMSPLEHPCRRRSAHIGLCVPAALCSRRPASG